MNHINPAGFFPLEHTKIGNDFPSPLEVETLVYVGEGKGNFNKDRELEDPHGTSRHGIMSSFFGVILCFMAGHT